MLVCLYLYILLAVFSAIIVGRGGEIDCLGGLDISSNIPKLDFLCKLKRIDIQTLKGIQNDLFDNDLLHQYDLLVMRRDSATRPAAWKLDEDIWDLLTCIRIRKPIPRTLPRAGKRCKKQFQAQGEKNVNLFEATSITSTPQMCMGEEVEETGRESVGGVRGEQGGVILVVGGVSVGGDDWENLVGDSGGQFEDGGREWDCGGRRPIRLIYSVDIMATVS